MATDSLRYKPYSEQVCKLSTTPLRTYNANIAILYVVLALIAIILAFWNSSKIGPATFDSHVYRLVGHYSSSNLVVPPASTASLVALTPWGTALALMGALIVGALFHLVYAIDYKRVYTLLLVDRCNGMRWAQFGIIHTILAVVVALMMGTNTFDFLCFALLALPCMGILGHIGDKSYPCCPQMMNVATLGISLLALAYWIPVITNFAYRYWDSGISPPPYTWIAFASLVVYNLVVILLPVIRRRSRMSYFIMETVSTAALVIISAIILMCVGWGLTEQTSA